MHACPVTVFLAQFSIGLGFYKKVSTCLEATNLIWKLTLDLIKDLEHLSACAKGVYATRFQGFVVQLNKIRPFHILQVVGIFVKTKAS